MTAVSASSRRTRNRWPWALSPVLILALVLGVPVAAQAAWSTYWQGVMTKNTWIFSSSGYFTGANAFGWGNYFYQKVEVSNGSYSASSTSYVQITHARLYLSGERCRWTWDNIGSTSLEIECRYQS